MGSYVFSEMEIDAIGEISNICLGTSASTLSMLVRQTVDITPPRVEIVEKSEYTKNVSSKKVFVKVSYVEGVKGCSILMLEEQDAKAIADLMMGSDGSGDFAQMDLSDLHLSAVSEAMNQMMGAAATSMSVMLERKTDISIPDTKFMECGVGGDESDDGRRGDLHERHAGEKDRYFHAGHEIYGGWEISGI